VLLPDQSLTLTTREVAALLRVEEHLVGKMAKRGEIPGAFRAGRLWRFPTTRVYRELLHAEPPPPLQRSET
jgi:excisionase family DNA binding protein